MAEQDRRWQRRGLSGEPRSPEYWLRPFFSCAREYLCWQCGAVYLAEPSRSRKRLCSNRCERQLIAEYGREWRKRRAEKLARLGEKPIHNVGRSERRREERAKLCCEWCGVAIEAGRSSRRYCSEAHRIAAHRKRHRVDRRVTVMDKSFSGE
jgi:hypothetical protein